MKDFKITPDKQPEYSELLDDTIPANVRGHKVYTGFMSSIDTLKQLGAV